MFETYEERRIRRGLADPQEAECCYIEWLAIRIEQKTGVLEGCEMSGGLFGLTTDSLLRLAEALGIETQPEDYYVDRTI